MYKEIKIGGEAVPMKATAATPFYYKQIFRTDLMKVFSAAAKAQDDTEEASSIISEHIPELAYVMKCQGAGEDMTTRNLETYVEWLETLEPNDIILASQDILMLYNGNKVTSAVPKKKAGR